MKTLKIEEISHDAFRPYGLALGTTPDGIRRNHFDAIANLRTDARLNLAQVRANRYQPSDRIVIDELERHAFSGQSFFPLNVGRYLVLVGTPTTNGAPDVSQLRAFSVPGDIGITYNPGVWHIGISVLDGGADFLMLVHEEGNDRDCDFVSVEPFELLR